jgi:hypothetical protein
MWPSLTPTQSYSLSSRLILLISRFKRLMTSYATTLAPPNPSANAFSNIFSSIPQSQQFSSQPSQRGGWMPGSGMAPKPWSSSAMKEVEQVDDPKPWATFEISVSTTFPVLAGWTLGHA